MPDPLPSFGGRVGTLWGSNLKSPPLRATTYYEKTPFFRSFSGCLIPYPPSGAGGDDVPFGDDMGVEPIIPVGGNNLIHSCGETNSIMSNPYIWWDHIQ